MSSRSRLVGRLLGDETLVFSEALRILRVFPLEEGEARKGVPQGPRIEASRNFWEGSGLKIDSSSTDVVWGHGSEFFDRGRARSLSRVRMTNPEEVFSNKILTSARNGEIITWDLNKNCNAKYGMYQRLLAFEFSHLHRKNDERATIRVRYIGCRTRPSSIIIAFRVPQTAMFGYG